MKEKIKRILPVGLFLTFTVFFYGPLSLYLPNAQELWFDLKILLKVVSIVSLAVLVVIFLVGIILPKKVNGIYTMLVFGVALATYIQGNFINVNYGVMDGVAVEWDRYRVYAIINSMIWVVCICLPFIATLVIKRIKKNDTLSVYTIIIYASLFFTAIQIPALISQVVSYTPGNQGDLSIVSDGIYDLAESNNTIVLVVDTYDELYYQQFMDAHPEYEDILDGFVHYRNTVTAGARTIVALPAMFTGRPFLKDSTYTDYLSDVWGKPNVMKLYKESGYDTRVYSASLYFDVACADYVDNFVSDCSVSNNKILGKKIYKLTGFKFVPHILKRYCEMETKEFDEARTSTENLSLHQDDDHLFFENLEKQGFVINKDYKGAFRLYHLNGIHQPYSFGKDGKRKDGGTLEEQTEGVMVNLAMVLQKMKDQGIYDSSSIVIVADHGDKHVAERAVFLYKPAKSKESYVTSEVPTSLFDLPILLTEIIGKKLPDQKYGMRLGELQPEMSRKRWFFVNTTNSSQVIIDEYVTNAHADDVDAIEKVQTHSDPKVNEAYSFGTELLFDADATGNRYTKEGFGLNTGSRTMLVGTYAKLVIPYDTLPETDMLLCKIGAMVPSIGTKMVISVNGEDMYETVLDKDTKKNGFNFDIPKTLLEKSDEIVIEVTFPDIPEEEAAKNKNYLSFVSLVIEEK